MKNNLRIIEAQIVQKLKNNEARPNLLVLKTCNANTQVRRSNTTTQVKNLFVMYDTNTLSYFYGTK